MDSGVDTEVLDLRGVVELVVADGRGDHGHAVAQRLFEAEVAGVGDEGLGVGVAQDILTSDRQHNQFKSI